MADARFFDAPTEASIKKQRIVSKYFGGWANIIFPTALPKEGKIMYVDLFSGPGRYKDGSPSTPLLVLEHVIKTPALRENTVLFFNDEKAEFVESLEQNVANFPGVEMLKHKPVFRNKSVGREIIPKIEQVKVPTLFFADPWGYAGISIDLIEASIRHWGSDFLFFFNYNRINMNLGCGGMNEAINEFFSTSRAEKLRNAIAELTPPKREEAILKEMQSAIKGIGAKVEKFTYRNKTGVRSTHHLLCVSRHPEGMALFKEISAKESTTFEGEIPSLQHDPSANPYQPLLFSGLDQLEEDLLATYEGKILTPDQIYHDHHIGKPYIQKNYRQALLHLEETGAVKIDPPRSARVRSESFPQDTRVIFSRIG
jgi:three-Cys-motif partner protein